MPDIETTTRMLLTRFNEGALDDALTLARDAVRTNPAEPRLRVLLAELQCFEAAFEKADQHLETAAQIDPSLAVGVAQFRHIVRAAVARDDFYTRGRVPSFLVEPSPELKARLRAAVALREGQVAEAVEQLRQAEALRAPVPGTCDGTPFSDFRDADDLLGAVLEVLTADGRYFWMPAELVQRIEFEAPERPRDLLFRPARFVAHDGTEGTVFMPALYHGSAAATEAGLKLGRATDWITAEGAPVRGVGQRIWLVGETDVALLDVGRLEFTPASGSGRP